MEMIHSHQEAKNQVAVVFSLLLFSFVTTGNEVHYFLKYANKSWDLEKNVENIGVCRKNVVPLSAEWER